MADMKNFLGTGWGFPPTFDRETKNVQMVSDLQDIEQSIHIILSTTPGERVMQPEFGCGLKRLVFEQIDSTLEATLRHIIYQSLLDFEPRINVIDIVLLDKSELDGILHIQINYEIIITNTRHNIVYPFYLLEGTNISTP